MQQNGFTLIELMVTVAIIAIIASIAYPSYLDSVIRTKRVDAQSALIEAASFMERIYTENNSYSSASGALPNYDVDDYQISISAISSTSYTLQAVPTGSQKKYDSCGTLGVDNTGKQTYEGDSGCW